MRLALVALSTFVLLSAPLPTIAKDHDVSYEEFEGMTITDVQVTGFEKTQERYLRREIESEVGEPLDPEVLEEDRARLTNLGILSTVVIIVEESEGGVALEYVMTELGDVIPYPALAYSETAGWSYGGAIFAANAFGRVIRMSGFALFGGTTTYGVTFRHPWIAGDRVFFDAAYKHTVLDNFYYDFLETNDLFSPWVGTWLGHRGRIKGNVGYFAIESDRDGRTLSEDNRDEMIRAAVSLSYDSRDINRDPHRGWQLIGEAMGSKGVYDTPARYLTVTFDVRRYQPTLWGNTLAAGVLLSMQSGTVDVDIPMYMQYNLGGANSIRGYTPEGLGEVLFGKNQLIATIEQRFDLIDITQIMVLGYPFSVGLQAALFLDSGIAWSDADEFNWRREKRGVGVGLRPLVPWVDMIRFDVGFNENWNATFHLGFTSKFDAQRRRNR